jgi:hypothetical protein
MYTIISLHIVLHKQYHFLHCPYNMSFISHNSSTFI